MSDGGAENKNEDKNEGRGQVIMEGKKIGDEMSGIWYYTSSPDDVEKHKFWYKEKLENRWEGYFELKMHTKHQKVNEWFILTKQEDNMVVGNGKNTFGAFFVCGEIADNLVRLERSYAARAPRKKNPVYRELTSRTKSVRAATKRKQSFDFVQVDHIEEVSESESESSDEEENEFLKERLLEEQKVAKKKAKKKMSRQKKKEDLFVDLSKKKNSTTAKKRPKTIFHHDHIEARSLTYTLERTFIEDTSGAYKWLWSSLENDEVYEGTVNEAGLRHGVGTCIYLKNKLTYRGEWRLGREHGKGALFQAESRKLLYLGDFVDGKMHGSGTCYLANGDLYVGDLRENARQGKGKYITKCGDKYIGEWRENQRHGRGTFTTIAGSSYTGEWQRDLRNGKGELRLPDGTEYHGTFLSNQIDGKGECTYPDGQKYQGIFKNGLRQGRGNLQWPCGASYEGRFRDDHIDGSGGALAFPPRPLPLVAQKFSSSSSQQSHQSNDDSDGAASSPNHKSVPPAGWLIPVQLKNDIARIHQRAGFDQDGF